jgi:hypothetical protein
MSRFIDIFNLRMRKLYYNIWADAIKSFRKHHPDSSDWKIKIFNLMTFTNALNFWVVFYWLQYFDLVHLPVYNLNLPIGKLNDFIMFILTFASPFVIINYFLIYYSDRYKVILTKYPTSEKKYALTYSMIVLGLTMITAFMTAVIQFS